MENNNETAYVLSAPAHGGYRKEFTDIDELHAAAANLLGCTVDEMVLVDPADTTFCYASQADADADRDGAYAVQYGRA